MCVRSSIIVYYNTKKTISVDPDESVIVNEELPLAGSLSGEKITAYAFISEEKLGNILVCLVNGESVTVKGSGGACASAILRRNGFSYSLSFEPGISEDAAALLFTDALNQ